MDATETAPSTGAQRRRPPADWGRAAEGFQLAGIAVFLLLNTTGVLPWSFWLDAIALWPVLIMSAGLKVAFEKSRAPWLLMLGPVLVLGSLAWVASGARTDLPVGPWSEETKPRPPDVTRVRLAATLAAARLSVTTSDLDSGLLVDTRSMSRPRNARVTVSSSDGQALVDLKGGWGPDFALPRKQRWDLRLPAGLPLALEVRGAGVRTRADLSRGRVEGGRIDGVFLGTELVLPAPDRRVSLEVSGVFNSLHVTVPDGVPVKVEGAGFPFNAVDRGVEGNGPGYAIRLNGIFSAVSVDTRAAAPASDGAGAAKPPAEAPPSR
jgi:hypothetical protein